MFYKINIINILLLTIIYILYINTPTQFNLTTSNLWLE